MSVPMSWPQALRATLIAAGLAASWSTDALAQSKPPEAKPMNTLQTQPSSSLRALFAAEWERSLQDSPETASYMGDTRFNDRWTDFSLAAVTAREAADREALVRLRKIGRSALSEPDKLDYDIFE